MTSQQVIQCQTCLEQFPTTNDRDAHAASFQVCIKTSSGTTIDAAQFRAHQLLLHHQRLQQKFLVELNRCLAHQEVDKYDLDEEKTCNDNGNYESDEDKEDNDNDDEGDHRNDKNIDKAARLHCPECNKKLPSLKGLQRHYPIRINHSLSFQTRTF